MRKVNGEELVSAECESLRQCSLRTRRDIAL
jgi:hypothetical protein